MTNDETDDWGHEMSNGPQSSDDTMRMENAPSISPRLQIEIVGAITVFSIGMLCGMGIMVAT